MSKKFTELKFAVVTHEYFKGSGQELKDYLINHRVSYVAYVAHLFFYSKVPSISYLERFSNGTLLKRSESLKLPRSEFLMYLRDAFYTFYYLLFNKTKYDYYFGFNSFNAIFGLCLKLLGKVDKVCFFTIDYVMEKRFKQGLLNKLYVLMDRIAFWNSDFTLNVSERMATQRIIELGDSAKSKKQITVPIGIMTEAFDLTVNKKKNILVYSGGLTPEFGLERIINSMPKLLGEFPDLELRIIGDGVLKNDLQKLVSELHIESSVNFVGYIDTSKERERWLQLLKESTMGIATYQDTESTYKKFSDVTKPKDYMSCGLPIITTAVIPLSEDVKKFNLGRVVEDNVESIVSAVSDLLRNESERTVIEDNVYKYCSEMTWENIFNRMFNEMGEKL